MNDGEPARPDGESRPQTPTGQPAAQQPGWDKHITVAALACIVVASVAFRVTGGAGTVTLTIIGGVSAVVLGMVGLVKLGLHREITISALWIITAVAVIVISVAGFQARYGSQDAALVPKERAGLQPGSTLEVTVTAKAKKKYVRLTFGVEQENPNAPTCKDEIVFRVRPAWLQDVAELRPGRAGDVSIGSPPPGPRKILVSVESAGGAGAECMIRLSTWGTLHN